MMTSRAVFHERFAVIFPGRMAIRTLHAVPCNVGFVENLTSLKGTVRLSIPNMCTACTGDAGFNSRGVWSLSIIAKTRSVLLFAAFRSLKAYSTL